MLGKFQSGSLFPDAPECTVLAVMNSKSVKFSMSEYAPPEILIPFHAFGHCR